MVTDEIIIRTDPFSARKVAGTRGLMTLYLYSESIASAARHNVMGKLPRGYRYGLVNMMARQTLKDTDACDMGVGIFPLSAEQTLFDMVTTDDVHSLTAIKHKSVQGAMVFEDSCPYNATTFFVFYLNDLGAEDVGVLLTSSVVAQVGGRYMKAQMTLVYEKILPPESDPIVY